MRECPAECGRHVSGDKLLCAPCWRRVPDDLKGAVNRTWARYQRAVGRIGWTSSPTSRQARTEARTAYQEARGAALASIQ